MVSIRKEIRELNNYFVPQQKDIIKLNQNESPFDLPFSLKKEINQEWTNFNWARYPEYENQELLLSLAQYTGHHPKGILLGNGSNELIQSIFLTFLEKGEKLLVPEPCFSIYYRLGRILQTAIIFSKMNEDFQYEGERILEIIKKSEPELIVFPSPHNPCGAELEKAVIEEMCHLSPGIVVIDEAYYEFSGKTVRELVDKFDNLLILRTFSKAFGLAGLRVGYLLGKPALIDQISKVKLPFSVNSFNQLALLKVLNQREYMEKVVSLINQEREKLTQILSQIKEIKTYPSQANFILFEIRNYPAKSVFEKLREREILVRQFASFRLKNCLRVTVGQEKENQIFIEKLKEIINELRRK